MSFDEGVEAFVTECHELLEEMESALLEWEENAGSAAEDPEVINRIFRAMHTIKGSAGLFGFEEIIAFTHVAENLLSDIRKGEIEVTQAICGVLIKCKDQVEVMVGAIEGGDPADSKISESLVNQLNNFMKGMVSDEADSMGTSSPANQEKSSTLNHFSVTIHLDINNFREGFDPGSYLRGLKELGECSNWQFLSDRIPGLQDFEPDLCYLSWSVDVRGELTQAQIEEVFEFSEGTQLIIKPLNDEHQTANQEQHSVDSVNAKLAAAAESVSSDPSATASDDQQAQLKTEATGASPQSSGNAKQPQKVKAQPQLRVNAEKLDKLINLVGEMVTLHTQVARVVEETNNEPLIENISSFKTILEEVRESALGLRMIAIGSTLERFKRVVRDVSKELGKEINLEIVGGDTELDKAVIEQITDPLMHMLRNSMDHGIEGPDERVKAGKSANGTIMLKSYHESGAIVLEITDDGRGLDKDRILEKARSQGIVGANQQLQDGEIFQLIFAAGFSTSQTISNISGRGVGMDVVRRNIESLRGQIDVESIMGRGTRFTIRIPLTLSIIDGFLVKICEEEYVIPLASINECLALSHEEAQQCSDGRNLMNIRNEFLPLLHLDEYLGLRSFQESSSREEEVNIVVVEFAGKKVGLIVDELVGEIQAVIKPLGNVFYGMNWVSGFTILGGGNVALIFDVAGMIKEATSRDSLKNDHDRATDKEGLSQGGSMEVAPAVLNQSQSGDNSQRLH